MDIFTLQSALKELMIENLKFSPDEFESKFSEFPEKYQKQFNGFWERKLSIESKGPHILDEGSWKETYEKLDEVLKKWQYFRGSRNAEPHKTPKESLEKMQQLTQTRIELFNALK